MSLEGRIRLIVVIGFALALECACRSGLIPHTVLIPPTEMLAGLFEILEAGTFNADIISTSRDILSSAVLSIFGGFVAGLAIHALPGLRVTIEPLIASYYAVPTFMFYPVFIILFGVGHAAIVAIAVLLAIVAMISATLNGLDRIPDVLRKTARIHRLPRLKTAVMIELPAAAPYLFTGVKLAVAYAFIGVIASEFILSGSGIGYAIAYAYNNFENRTMYALMLLILLMVTLVNALLDEIDKRLRMGARR